VSFTVKYQKEQFAHTNWRSLMEGNFGVLVLGHGSKLTYNKNTVEAVANMLAEKMNAQS